MISGWVLLLVSVVYVGVLFWVAHYGDRKPLYPERAWLRPIVYSLALAVYCSSWTFYGAVGSAAHSGWGYLPIYLGPVLLFVLFQGIPKRLVQIAHEQSITSIADFLGAVGQQAGGVVDGQWGHTGVPGIGMELCARTFIPVMPQRLASRAKCRRYNGLASEHRRDGQSELLPCNIRSGPRLSSACRLARHRLGRVERFRAPCRGTVVRSDSVRLQR